MLILLQGILKVSLSTGFNIFLDHKPQRPLCILYEYKNFLFKLNDASECAEETYHNERKDEDDDESPDVPCGVIQIHEIPLRIRNSIFRLFF